MDVKRRNYILILKKISKIIYFSASNSPIYIFIKDAAGGLNGSSVPIPRYPTINEI